MHYPVKEVIRSTRYFFYSWQGQYNDVSVVIENEENNSFEAFCCRQRIQIHFINNKREGF